MTPPSRRTVLVWLASAPLARFLPACSADGGAGADTDAADAGVDAAADAAADAVDAADAGVDGGGDVAPEVCHRTLPDAQGPFFQPNAPEVTALAPVGEPGTALAIGGRVLDAACLPIAGATVEVWQADDAGDYHDDKLRGTLTASAEGAFAFTTVVPGRYLQASGLRPAHLHFRVSAPGYDTVVTQVYFEGDPYLQPNDSCGSCGSDDPARIIALTDAADGSKLGQWDAVL